jgi:hypothetical protein
LPFYFAPARAVVQNPHGGFGLGSQLFLDWPASGGDPILKPPIGMLLQDESAPANFGRGQTAGADFAVVNGLTERITVIR